MNLKKNLVILDLETTGVWIEKDKIVEMALIRFSVEGTRDVLLQRTNPGIAIPQAVSQLIGITDEDVKKEPYFKEVASQVLQFMEGADLAGFNLERFDLPLLEREMFEAGLKFEWQGRRIFDAQKIYHLNERRDLTAAYQFYCQKELEGAHSAMADAQATWEILCSQAQKYGNGMSDLEALCEFKYKSISDYYDQERKFRWWNGELYPMFGRYAKRLSLQEIARKDRKYLEWILSADFTEEVKELAQDALQGKFPVYSPAREF